MPDILGSALGGAMGGVSSGNPYAALAGAGLSVAGGLLGAWWASKDEKEQRQLQDKAASLYNDVSPASMEKVMADELGPSALGSVQVDTQARDARRAALSQLMDIGSHGGNDEGSRLAVEQARRASAQQESAQRNALVSQTQRRGLGNGGLAMQAQLQAQSAGADRNSLAGMQGAADARTRALQALQLGSQSAAGLEQDDYTQQANKAQAADRIAQFNSQATTDAAKYRNSVAQQQWQDSEDVRNQQAQGYWKQADAAGQRAARKQQIAGGIGNSLNYGVGSYFGGGKRP